jgi:hypothetical protein
MRITKTISIVTLFLSVTAASGQTILQNYFKVNKDSLVIEANNLINMPEPAFKPSQPTKMAPETIKDMGFEQVYKSEDYYFTSKDEALNYELLKKAKIENSRAQVQIIEGVTHNGIRQNPQPFEFIKNGF